MPKKAVEMRFMRRKRWIPVQFDLQPDIKPALSSRAPKFSSRNNEPIKRASLSMLPDELLLEILSYFEGNSPQLQCLCLVSHKLLSIAEDILYRSINVPQRQEPVIHKLLATLFQRPELAKKAHSLKFIACAFDRRSGVRQWPPVELKERISTKEMIKRGYQVHDFLDDCVRQALSVEKAGFYYTQNQVDWKTRLQNRDHGAFCGLLISLLPNLLHLDVNIGRWRGDRYAVWHPSITLFSYDDCWADFNHQPFHAIGNLKNLQTLRMPGRQHYFINLRFPKLHTLEFYCGEADLTCTRQVYPGLQTLILRDGGNYKAEGSSYLTPKVVQRVLLHLECFSLTTFDFLGGDAQFYGNSALDRNYEVLVDGLRPVWESLETLRIDIIGSREDRVHEVVAYNSIFDNITPVDFLCTFTQLKHLSIPQHVLFNKNTKIHSFFVNFSYLLPPNLEVLTIYWPGQDIITWLQDLYSTSLNSFKNLKTINLVCRKLSGKSANWFRDRNPKVFSDLRHRNVAVHIVQEEIVFKLIGDTVSKSSRNHVDWMEGEDWFLEDMFSCS